MSKNFPLATVIYYGPNDKTASKAVVSIFHKKDGEPAAQRKWFGAGGDLLDLRSDAAQADEMVAFIKAHDVKRTVFGDGIWGCPHEEGIDYATGGFCPQCPWWIAHPREF